MQRALLIAFATLLAFGGGARGAEAPGARAQCKALTKLQGEFDAKTHFTTLTPGQFHFIEGVYVGSPTTPAGLPPGDGAILVTHDGDKSGIVIWTRGAIACAPIPINERLIKLINGVKTGDGEDGESL